LPHAAAQSAEPQGDADLPDAGRAGARGEARTAGRGGERGRAAGCRCGGHRRDAAHAHRADRESRHRRDGAAHAAAPNTIHAGAVAPRARSQGEVAGRAARSGCPLMTGHAFDAWASASVNGAHDGLWSSAMAASMMRWRELGPRRPAVIALNFLSTACASMPWREKPGGSSTSARYLRPSAPVARIAHGKAPGERAL